MYYQNYQAGQHPPSPGTQQIYNHQHRLAVQNNPETHGSQDMEKNPDHFDPAEIVFEGPVRRLKRLGRQI